LCYFTATAGFPEEQFLKTIPIGDAHIVILILSEPSRQNYDPSLVLHYAY
jgi:hypothetical protein